MLAPFMTCPMYYQHNYFNTGYVIPVQLLVGIVVSVNLCTLVSLMITLINQNPNVDYNYLFLI